MILSSKNVELVHFGSLFSVNYVLRLWNCHVLSVTAFLQLIKQFLQKHF